MMNVETTGMKQRGCSPLTNLRKVGFLVPEEDLVKCAELETLSGLVLKEDFECFVALTLGFPQVDVPRWEKLKVLLDPEVFPRMIL